MMGCVIGLRAILDYERITDDARAPTPTAHTLVYVVRGADTEIDGVAQFVDHVDSPCVNERRSVWSFTVKRLEMHACHQPMPLSA